MITFLSPLVAKFALQLRRRPSSSRSTCSPSAASSAWARARRSRSIASMMLGFALAAVGMDTVTGQLRMTFGLTELLRGFDFLIAVIGLFGIGEILLTMEEGLAVQGQGGASINTKVVCETWKELPRYWMTSLRSSLVGCWMGITPGGATPASFMSYGLAKKMSRERRQVRHRRGRRRGRAGDGGARGRHPRAAADADARHPGLADGGGAARRPADLGPAARAAAVRRAEGLRLGPDRQHVPRQHRRPDRRADAACRCSPRSCACRSRSSRR